MTEEPFATVAPQGVVQEVLVFVCTEQEAYWYEPESVPLLQVLCSETHCCPVGTVEDW